MSATVHTTTHIHGTPYANTCAIFLLALLAGCATINTAQTAASSAESGVCNTDTDTFCIESDQQKAAKLNQQGLEFATQLDYGHAVESLEKAIALDSTNPEYFYNLGVAYSYKGMAAEEEAAYMAALAIKPDSSDNPKLNRVWANVYFNLACLYALQGKKDQAFEQLDKLATLGANQLFHSLQSDKDLDSLRDDPRFKTALDKIANSRKSPAPAPLSPVQ